jgi:hypothetical protein
LFVRQIDAVDTTASFVSIGYDLSDIAVVAATKATAPTDLFVHQQTVALVNERANDQYFAPFAFQLIRESRETGSLPVPRHTDSTDHGVQPPCGLLFAFASKNPFH